MSAFHDVRLELPRALGAVGGVERRVDVVALANGKEFRNSPWAHGRRRFEIGGTMMSQSALYDLAAFFEARGGRMYGFRFRDPMDWKSCKPDEVVTPFDQVIGVGDGAIATFQLVKSYGDAPFATKRTITKPVEGGVRLAVGGVEVSSAAFVVDSMTGLATLDTPPGLGDVITAGFEFDTPVRFDIERLDISFDAVNAGRAVSAPLIEVLV